MAAAVPTRLEGMEINGIPKCLYIVVRFRPDLRGWKSSALCYGLLNRLTFRPDLRGWKSGVGSLLQSGQIGSDPT